MSTFAAPASATSGLQGYDLEGADRPARRKVSKGEARYGDNAKTKQCMSCVMFLAPDACTKVTGKIAPTGHCKFYYGFANVEKAAGTASFRAAGIALVEKEYGKALFIKRSGEGDHAGEWCFPGGGIDGSETPLEAALREAVEEVGFTVPHDGDLTTFVATIESNGVEFTTFFQRVDKAFEAKLNEEHTDYRWEPLERPPQPLHPGVRAVLPMVVSAATELTLKSAKRTLYVRRPLINGEHLVNWAKANGFATTLPDTDMHVTIAYSKEAVDWDAVPRSSLPILRIEGGGRELARFGKDGEAVVLKLESEELAARHREIRQAGASWDWPYYKPNVTLTYAGKDISLDELAAFDGVLEFGPEAWAEVQDNYMDSVVEKHDGVEQHMDNLSLFVPVLKVDAKQRMVYGTAVIEQPDRTNEIFDYASSKPEFEKWSSEVEKASGGKSLGNVRSMHGKVAAGKLTDIGFDDERKAIDVAAKVVDEEEWQKVQEGVYTGFSIGGRYLKKWQDGAYKRYTAAPSEVSLVDLPCVKDATFALIKADGSEELRKFASTEQAVEDGKTEPVEITNDMVAKRAEELAKVSGKPWADHVDEARAALEAEAVAKAAEKDAKPADGEGEVAKGTEAEVIAPVVTVDVDGAKLADTVVKGVDDDIEQVWTSKRLPGKSFAKKAELREALNALDIEEEAARKAAPVLDLIKGVTNPEAKADPKADPKAEVKPEGEGAVEKREFSDSEREKDAKSGAAEADGSYPIENATDLENAVKAYGRSKNKAKTKRHIIKRARALGLTDKLPEGWVKKVADGEDLAKGASLYLVADLMYMLSCVESLEERAELSAEVFGGIDVPKELTDRFGSLLVDLGDITADILDVVLADTRNEEAAEAAAKAAPVMDLFKRGARNSASDKALIKQAHDILVTLDKDACAGVMGKAEGGDLEKAAKVEALSSEVERLTGALEIEKSTNSKALAAIAEGVEALKSQLEKVNGDNKELAEKLEKAQGDLSAIRSTPLPAPAGPYRVVEKTVDTLTVGQTGEVDETTLRKNAELAKLNRTIWAGR